MEGAKYFRCPDLSKQEISVKSYVSIIVCAYASVTTVQFAVGLNCPRKVVGYLFQIGAHTTIYCQLRPTSGAPANCDCQSEQ